MRSNVSVKYLDRDGRLLRYVSQREAHRLVNENHADWPHRNIREIVRASAAKTSGGWPALKKAAVDKFPRYVVGGLTRTEH